MISLLEQKTIKSISRPWFVDKQPSKQNNINRIFSRYYRTTVNHETLLQSSCFGGTLSLSYCDGMKHIYMQLT